MFSKLIASFLITFSVFLGAELSNKYPNFSPNEIQGAANSFSRSQSAAVVDSESGLEVRPDLWSIFRDKTPQPQRIPLQRLPESENVPPPNIDAEAAISVTEKGRILFQKNADQPLPVASLTKLLTALVVSDRIPLSETVGVNRNAIDTYGQMGGLVVGEEISVESLLYIMLMDSSNDAAVALAEAVEGRSSDGKIFPELMNAMAQKLGMTDSHFSDPAGLNPDNLSTASDLVKLIAADLNNPLIKKILGTDQIDVFSINNSIKHHLKNTNKLLDKTTGIIGGKTGYTEEAGECMILIADARKNSDRFFVVLLGAVSGMRFSETEKIVDWTRQNYGW
ncbi:MAG: D-alanyl-D-alanine carboxypeptidase [Candidatus Portnoybacteria bacterium]|nr:D-alanyl-D-alanine carboxypeptidase [Candidatus Portnoybacteria bacterium]